MNEKITLISNQKNWMDSLALEQLQKIAGLPDVVRAVGLPDLHAGKTPVGFTVLTENVVYPRLLGGDIGCGMALFHTGMTAKKYKREKWQQKLEKVQGLENVPLTRQFGDCPMHSFGTIGGGNHFAEFQIADNIIDEAFLTDFGIQQGDILLLVHSGSRDLGQQIAREFQEEVGLSGSCAEEYLCRQNEALWWAKENRKEIACKLFDILGFTQEPQLLLDSCHNFAVHTKKGILHRKGAVSAKEGAAVVPGSRGSLTYLMRPLDDTSLSLDSLSHGAGRKWARSMCRPRLKSKYTWQTIRQTSWKSFVICHDAKLLFEEAPEAYKKIEHVISSLEEHRLAVTAATFRPLLTFKD